ncbi:hypothetical protein [Pseudarthrobacter sp. Y6]|uniref:hypothetical protein n=1 Tax=Pseudarthrobacter sp. Y6 TaxID=3418422 RepID=UPI003CE95563
MRPFNPGWSQNAEALDSFTDVRNLQRELKAQGAEFVSEADEADEATTGPGSFVVVDPDGTRCSWISTSDLPAAYSN